ncbi:uncharacterized protein PSFLO_05222 [Pseudozyma flocculosa]|uniref:Uncharacterized protein n=1 Tax=Pseudozyma flocculosa TaxID=84751 RepID=A0A5C3F8R4_9BASI|nr:uncharacterized protein PSFLO_05222 [Pseudozyma flocculosa]
MPPKSTRKRAQRSRAHRSQAQGSRSGAPSHTTRPGNARRGPSDADAAPAAEPLELDYGTSEANPITLDSDSDDDDKGLRDAERSASPVRDGSDSSDSSSHESIDELESDSASEVASPRSNNASEPNQIETAAVGSGLVRRSTTSPQAQQSNRQGQDVKPSAAGELGAGTRLSPSASATAKLSTSEPEEGEVSEGDAEPEPEPSTGWELSSPPRPARRTPSPRPGKSDPKAGPHSQRSQSGEPRASSRPAPNANEWSHYESHAASTPQSAMDPDARYYDWPTPASSRYAEPYPGPDGYEGSYDSAGYGRQDWHRHDRVYDGWHEPQHAYYPPHPPHPAYNDAAYGYPERPAPSDYPYPAEAAGPYPSSSRQHLSAHAEPYYPWAHRSHLPAPGYPELHRRPDPAPPPDSRLKRKATGMDGYGDSASSRNALPEPPAKLLKRKTSALRSGEAAATARPSTPSAPKAGPLDSTGREVPGMQRESRPKAPPRIWTDKERQEALELVAKLAACGMSPSKLVEEGVNAQIVRACCTELGIAFEGGDDASGAPRQVDQTTAADRAQELRQAALATLRRKVIASRAASVRKEVEQNPDGRMAAVNKLLQQAQQNAMLSSDSGDRSSPPYEPPEPEAESEQEAGNASVPAPSADVVVGRADEHDESGDDMALDTSSSEADPSEQIGAGPSKPRAYRDVDRPANGAIDELGFAPHAATPARRQQISYADTFSRRPDTPAGEVDLDAPLPTLAPPPPPPPSDYGQYGQGAMQQPYWGYGAPDAGAQPPSYGYAPGVPLWQPSGPRADMQPNGQRRRRPVAADFEGPALASYPFDSVARRTQFVRQPFRVRLVIDLSDDDGDEDHDDNGEDTGDASAGQVALPVNGSRPLSRASIRRQTAEAMHALYLTDRGLPVPGPSTPQPQLQPQAQPARPPLSTTASFSANAPPNREGSQSAASTPKVDVANGELLKKEQDIKLLLQRIRALERRKNTSDAGTPGPAESTPASASVSGPATPDDRAQTRTESPTRDRSPVPVASAQDHHAAAAASPVTLAVASPQPPADAPPKVLKLDPKLRLQREKLLASLKQKKAAVEASKGRDEIGTPNAAPAPPARHRETASPSTTHTSAVCSPVNGDARNAGALSHSPPAQLEPSTSSTIAAGSIPAPKEDNAATLADTPPITATGAAEVSSQDQPNRLLPPSAPAQTSDLEPVVATSPAAYTSTLLQNMTERFKTYISPFARFPSFRSLSGARPNEAAAEPVAAAQSDSSGLPTAKRWCTTEAGGATCDVEGCRMAHVRDYVNASAVEPHDSGSS